MNNRSYRRGQTNACRRDALACPFLLLSLRTKIRKPLGLPPLGRPQPAPPAAEANTTRTDTTPLLPSLPNGTQTEAAELHDPAKGAPQLAPPAAAPNPTHTQQTPPLPVPSLPNGVKGASR